ncbi:hypothetical protein ACFQL3_01590 [Natronoarchaeum sp. GCM10025321]|uniref:hypothetical protein n=2 Tax=unclassified Natronoarchaeum TaxID=2620183 RepID=UPI00361DED33
MSSGRSRARSRRVLPATVLLLVVLLLGATLLPAASYSTADVDRGATLGITDDPQALIALDTATGVRIGHTDQLVVVTNNLQNTATMTVTLNDASATKADLVVDGISVGDEYTVDLDATESVAVDVAIPDDDTYVDEKIVFDTSADSVGIDAVATNRSATIEDTTQ